MNAHLPPGPPGSEPSHELRGEVFGLLCAGHPSGPDAILTGTVPDDLGWGASERRFWQIMQPGLDQRLAEGSLDFELGLPSDEVALRVRVEALCGWLSGFLSSFGWMDPMHLLSPESREALEDLAKIRCAEPPAESDEVLETAFAELVEYVRAAVQFLYDERHRLTGRYQAGSEHES